MILEMIRQTVSVTFLCIMVSISSAGTYAANVILDQDTTIDASNSYPEPPSGAEPLTLDIVDGVSGPASVEILDGGVIGGFVNVRGSSQLSMTGGQIQALTTIFDNATLTMAEGSIEPLIEFYDAADAAGVIRLKDNARMHIRGGHFFGSLLQEDASRVDIYGHSFLVNGDLPTSTEPLSGVNVSGVYADGNSFDIHITRMSENAQVFLHTVPESPSITAVISLVGMLFGARVRCLQ
jgi:hypothetical protein